MMAFSKRKLQRSKVKDLDKPFNLSTHERFSRCKLPLLKLVLLFAVSGTFITLLYSPEVNNHISNTSSGPKFVNRWIWGGPDIRYVSRLNIVWDDVVEVLERLGNKKEYHGIGLLNFNKSEVINWKQLNADAEYTVLHLDYAEQDVTWDSLYPEWIDEEEEEEVPICPSLPKLRAPGKRLDLIAVKLPCRNEGNWSRDVARLHLQLAAASVAASAKGNYPVHLLFITNCFPIPNLFTCKDLVARRGNVWLYRPNLNVIREKIQLPVGSCELALPSGNMLREAYATILHSAHVYVCGAIAAAQSIRMSGSTRDLVILVDETISSYHKSGLLIFRNIDFLFGMPEISATGNNGTLFNSGVMLIEPSNCTFQLLMEHINEFESYNGGDQGYLNEVFTWWHRIPKHMNFLKNFWMGDDEETKQMKTRLFGADPPILYVLHYLGTKPWMCFRDYDCNWNVDIMQEFASDVAHQRWWQVHDQMPELLQQFCLRRRPSNLLPSPLEFVAAIF